MIVENFPGRQIKIHEENHLYFGGTSYLGMSNNKDFQNLIYRGINKWGASYGSSRNANIQLSVYEKAENLFSDWIEAETSITVSSGALAGKMVIEYLSKTPVTFYHYPKTHPAILAKNSLPLFADGKLHPSLLDNIKEEVIITADAMLPLEVFQTSFEFINTIQKNKIITLVVDESHSLGIVGNRGQGVFATIPIKRLKRKIMISSLGKALGISGGIIASDNLFIDSIKKEPAFITSSGSNPSYLEAFTASGNLYETQLIKLRSNLKFLFNEMNSKAKHQQNESYPVLYYNQKGFYESLLEKKIIITSFDYPSYTEPMNRIVITSNHTESDLSTLAKTLNEVV